MFKLKKSTEKEVSKNFHLAFLMLIVFKGLAAILEIAGSFIILNLTPAFIERVAALFTSGELDRDPNDFISTTLRNTAHSFAIHGKEFAFTYLLLHGTVKLYIIIQILRKKMWAYPAGITLFSFFVIYQLYRYTVTQSPFLILFSGLDVLVILLTLWEYRGKVKKSLL